MVEKAKIIYRICRFEQYICTRQLAFGQTGQVYRKIPQIIQMAPKLGKHKYTTARTYQRLLLQDYRCYSCTKYYNSVPPTQSLMSRLLVTDSKLGMLVVMQ